jgi:hypothetical protein
MESVRLKNSEIIDLDKKFDKAIKIPRMPFAQLQKSLDLKR